MATIYTSLISKINTILSGIPKLKVAYSYPVSKITAYPAVVFFPSGVTNEFHGTNSNFKVYTFKVFVVVGATQTTINNVYSTVLPNAIDAFLAGFDDGWDFETIDGHRVWQEIEAGTWTSSEDKDGIEVSAEFDLNIRMLTSVN